LEAVLAFLRGRGLRYDDVVILGDYVDYGTRPNEVIEWARENCSLCLLGNHDAALLNPSERRYFSDLALKCSLWTEKVIKPENLRFLSRLRPASRRGDIFHSHGSPADPLWGYVFSDEDARKALRSSSGAKIVLLGHTHIPSYFAGAKGQIFSGHVVGEEFSIKLMPSVRYVINPGSVGQPRDGLGGASFGILDSEEGRFTWYRVDYDITPLKDEIRRAGLPMSLLNYFL